MRKMFPLAALTAAVLAAIPVSAQETNQTPPQRQETTGARTSDGTSLADPATSLPPNAPLGSTPQTLPSTMSQDNAALDKLPTVAFQFPLNDEQKNLIAQSVAQASNSPSADKLSSVRVWEFLPDNVDIQAAEFPAEIKQQIPQARDFRFVKGDKRALIIDPVNKVAVGEIHF